MTIRTSVSFFLPALAFALASATVHAGERQHAVAGAVIGSAAGALIGHELSGRDGALVGGAIGAATGAAIATSGRRDRGDEGRYADEPRYHDTVRDHDYHRGGHGYERERVVYREVPVVQERVVYRQAPVVVFRPVPVGYSHVRPVMTPVPVHYVGGDRYDHKSWKQAARWHRKHGRGHGHGHGHGGGYGHGRDD